MDTPTIIVRPGTKHWVIRTQSLVPVPKFPSFRQSSGAVNKARAFAMSLPVAEIHYHRLRGGIRRERYVGGKRVTC